MSENESKSLDLLGLKPFGKAIEIATKSLIEGAAAFLGRICLPAAEELGLLFRDRVNHWRVIQASKIAEKAERKLKSQPENEQVQAHPRLVGMVIEHGSWVDADDVQEMWAGLLSSSCTKDGKDESNLMFMNLLAQLTTSQARMLSYGCENSKKLLSSSGLINVVGYVRVAMTQLVSIAGIDDINRLDRELDHLRTLGLLSGGVYLDAPLPWAADLVPTPLGLQMYVRCQGYTGPPANYFGLTKG
jgi:hypothetical protein